MHPRKESLKGFTIVELLIVVVVIAVIAAITIVAYNNVQGRAQAASAQAAVRQAATKIQTFAVDNNGNYPANLAAIGISDTGSTTYQYTVNNSASPQTFCLSATVSGINYYSSDSVNTPTAGTCMSSIFGSTYPYSAALWTDGGGGLKVATVFYSYNNSFTVKGGRVYLPSVPSGVSLTIFYVVGYYTGGTFSGITWSQVPSGIPNQYVTIPSTSLVTGWNSVTFPTPATINKYSAGVDGTSVWIGYYFSDGNDYVFTSSPQSSAIVSYNNPNLFMAETGFEGKDRSENNVGSNGGWTQALYGIDILTTGP